MANASVTSERLFIVRPSDPRLLFARGDEKGGYEWNSELIKPGAWFVVLGPETSDEKCHRMAQRFGLDAEGLIGLRDDDRWESCECHKWELRGGANG